MLACFLFFKLLSGIKVRLLQKHIYKFLNVKEKKYVPESPAFSQEKGLVKPVLSSHSKRIPKLVFKTNFHLLQVKSIAECSPWSILQYFRPSLSYHLSIRFLFCLFLSGRLRQVLLYSS